MRSAIAKGARRPKSHFAGLLEPFTEGSATLYLKEGRDLQTLAAFDLLRARQELGRDLVGFAGASLISELVLRAGTEEPHPALYREVTSTLDRVSGAGLGARAGPVLAGVWRVVSLLGFEPVTDRCTGCKRWLEPDEEARFDARAGGVACESCRPAGKALAPELRAELRAMTAGEHAAGSPFPREHVALLQSFLRAQIEPEREFRSLELLERWTRAASAAGNRQGQGT